MSSSDAWHTRVGRIATEVARPLAAIVDREARFPHEAMSALGEAGALAAAVPRELGGSGASTAELGEACALLGRACASTAAIFAMHTSQVACLARHGQSPFFHDYLRRIARERLLIASAASEMGTGGDLRSSIAPVERDGDRFTLKKRCTVVSYGEHADALLTTARSAPESSPSQQALVLLQKQDYTLERTGRWDALGMRGTCSPPYVLTAAAPVEQIFAEPFRTIAAETLVPTSHVLWSFGWLGLAEDAWAVARARVARDARSKPGITPPGATRLSRIGADLEAMRSLAREAARELDRARTDEEGARAPSFVGQALRINHLKIEASELTARICLECLQICGIEGYMNDGDHSVARHVRDALAAPLMISNDRLIAANAALLLVSKDGRGA
ncbi:acyl-CoA dehydrogenase family protein [Sorangium sp. So ce887]|uniref:acyl-CoA dehydrogenase family protein n=1 Tax=Sorangium sp. So ce887 TaxID=3133324 RepID=UPI003F5F4673